MKDKKEYISQKLKALENEILRLDEHTQTIKIPTHNQKTNNKQQKKPKVPFHKKK